ncbi:MAG TPA: helix-turn-helix transcriptional regulator [Thermoanaerobaculia bacterium]|nr:helix-turn-helix transcriptional regulator [Thermoanaerobaculia bacterium]
MTLDKSPALAFFSELGRALQILRDRAKLSGMALAERADMGKGQLSRYEMGTEQPKLETLARILDALEIEPLWLFHLMHKLSRGESFEALQTDLLLAEAGPLMPSARLETFRRLLDNVFELHAALIEDQIQAAPGARRGKEKRESAPI